MSELSTFCRQVRSRSAEHRAAMHAVRALPGQMISVLRQELDSLVRVVFLLAQTDGRYRHQLIKASVEGKKWTAQGSRRRVTDREMVALTDRLHGWTRSVYEFGCAFIHLSNLHDYRKREPLAQIPPLEREAILRHLRFYHGGPTTKEPTFSDIVPLLPRVFEKIADNLECYVKDLEQNGSLK